jgi:hypothetical protein
MKRLRRLLPEILMSVLTVAGILLLQEGFPFWGNWCGFLGTPFWWYVSVLRDRQFGTIPLHTVCTVIWARGVLFLYLPL